MSEIQTEPISTAGIPPCSNCGSTDFKSIKALMFLNPTSRGEISFGKDLSVKMPVHSSSIFEKYHNEHPFDYFWYTASVMFLVQSIAFGVLWIYSLPITHNSWVTKVTFFSIFILTFIVSILFKIHHRKTRSKWWLGVDKFSSRFVCTRCAHEWSKDRPEA